jgi:hypothetical protein
LDGPCCGDGPAYHGQAIIIAIIIVITRQSLYICWDERFGREIFLKSYHLEDAEDDEGSHYMMELT